MTLTYEESLKQAHELGVDNECKESIKKVLDLLGKARVEYMMGGSNTPILRQIFDIEKKIHQEITDIEELQK